MRATRTTAPISAARVMASAIALALMAPAMASAQLDEIELAFELRDDYAKGEFIIESPKFLTHYDDCRARGESEAYCRTLVTLCAAQEQPFFGGAYAGFFTDLGLDQVFKLDCGTTECYQCCHVPGMGCHTSFIGFPVINCNERYGEGTRPAGLTLIVDPDPMPGEACLTIPQTCEHIPICASEPDGFADLRARLDAGEAHPLTAPGAAANRAHHFARLLGEKWCGAIDGLHTGLPRDPELPSLERIGDVFDFLTGRGCEGWRMNVAAVSPFDWEAEWFAIRDEMGVIQPAASQRSALCQWGLFRLLTAIPNLGERLSVVEATVWPEALRDAYLAQIGDPDEAIRRHASPIVLDLLRCLPTVYDYRLLAVPLPGEPDHERRFNGCALGHAPRIFLDAAPLGEGRVALDVELRDPEAGGPYAADVPLTIFWGDGRVSRERVAAGEERARFEHAYAAPGGRKIIAMAENTSGLRGFGAVIVAVEGAGARADPVVVSALRVVDAVVRTETLTGNARTLYVEIEGHDATTDATHRLGLSPARPIDLFADTALGTWIAHNTGAAAIDRFTLRPHWRDGFYTGLQQVTLRPARIELHVFSTATGETVPVTLPIGPETVRVYAVGQPEPLAGAVTIDEAGAAAVLLHDREVLVERIEIDVPAALLAAAAPGPLAEDAAALGQASWFEERPGQFLAVGRGPDAGAPAEADGGVGDAGGPGEDAGAAVDDGGASGCTVARPGGGGERWPWLLAAAVVALRRTRRSRAAAVG